MRDHTKLIVFRLADQLAIAVYSETRCFPDEERFGLSSQMRRAAVSIAANIVEGAARRSDADYVRFLSIAYGSAKELQYEVSLAARLGYFESTQAKRIDQMTLETSKSLWSLIRKVRSARLAVDC